MVPLAPQVLTVLPIAIEPLVADVAVYELSQRRLLSWAASSTRPGIPVELANSLITILHQLRAEDGTPRRSPPCRGLLWVVATTFLLLLHLQGVLGLAITELHGLEARGPGREAGHLSPASLAAVGGTLTA